MFNRLVYDLTRFLELDPNAPTVMHATIVATLAGGDVRTVRRVYNSTAAAPFSDKFSDEFAGAVATEVQIIVSGRGLGGDGWYYDGAVYVSYDGLTRTNEHPRLDEYIAAYVRELNEAIVERNARAEEARNALRGVSVTADEVTA